MITLKNNSKIRLLILVSIIGIFSYLPQLFAIVTIAKEFSTTDNWWIPLTIGAFVSILNLVFRLFLILGILYISLLIVNYFRKEKLRKDGFKVILLNSPMIFLPFIVFGTIALIFRIINYNGVPELTGLRKGFEFYGSLMAWIISFIIYGFMLNEKFESKKLSRAVAGVTCIMVFLLSPPTL